MQEFTLKNDNGPAVKFKGKRIGSASSSPDRCHSNFSGETGCSEKLKIYKTEKANYVCSRIKESYWRGEHDTYEVSVCLTEAQIIEFFGQNRLAQILYDDADIKNVIEVE